MFPQDVGAFFNESKGTDTGGNPQSTSKSLNRTPRWSKLEQAGSSSADVLGPRTYFSMVAWGNKLWYFGGFGDAKERFNDMHSYDVVSGEWSTVMQLGEDRPKPLYLHTSVVYRNKMYVFGGSDGKDSARLVAFDFATSRWSECPQSGSIPSARYGHAACVCGSKMFVVGGCKRNSTYFKDSYMYDFETNVWSKFNDASMAMAYHTLNTLDNDVYMFGGFNGNQFSEQLYQLETTSFVSSNTSWMVVPCTGDIPKPRCGCALLGYQGGLYLFGGYSNNGHDNALYRLELKTRVWSKVKTTGPAPIPRAYLQAATLQECLYLFGGYDGTKCVTDFSMLDLAVPDLGNCLQTMTPEQIARYALRHFDVRRNSVLGLQELEKVFENLKLTVKPAAAGDGSYPFSLAVLPQLTNLGFKKDDALRVMEEMHGMGQDVSRVEVIVDRILASPTGKLEAPDLSRQSSERAKLRARLEEVMQEKDDLRMCKVCFERLMDCALQDCGHMAVCRQCAQNMIQKDLPCPICRTKIKGCFSVYWQ